MTGAGVKLRRYIPEADNSVTQWRRDADQHNFSSFKPDPQLPRRKGCTAQTPLNPWCVWCLSVCLSVPAVPLSAIRITFIEKQMSSFCCHSCSVIYASIRGPEWKHLWEGNVNHQSGAFRVASSQPRAAAITEYALFKFPLLCQSNDSANKLRILVFVSRICQVRLLISLAIHVFAETQNGESFFFSKKLSPAFSGFSITGTDSSSPWRHCLISDDLGRCFFFFFFGVTCITHHSFNSCSTTRTSN